MSAPNPLKAAGLPDDRANHEPSMEEILASIRRIISDDQSHASSRDIDQAETVAPSTPEIAAPQAVRKWSHATTAREDNGLKENTPEAVSPSLHPTERRRGDPLLKAAPFDSRQFFSRQTESKQADLKPHNFADTGPRARLDTETEPAAPRPVLRRGIEPVQAFEEEAPLISPATDAAVASSFNALFASQLLPNPEMLAELTRDILKPMLKAWLDDNLPIMVERLVRAEIERVARGGR